MIKSETHGDDMQIDEEIVINKKTPTTNGAIKRENESSTEQNDLKSKTTLQTLTTKKEEFGHVDYDSLIKDMKKLVGQTGSQKPLFHDVTFVVKDKEYYCSRAVLSTRSEYFYNLFKDEMNKPSVTIKLNDVDPNVFYNVLTFLCSGVMDILDTNVAIGCYTYCKKINLPLACEAAEDYLKKRINQCIQKDDMEQCVYILNTLLQNKHTFQGDALSVPLQEYMCTNGFEIFATPNKISDISPELVSLLISSTNLNVDETSLFKWIVDWGKEQLKKANIPETNEELRKFLEGGFLDKILFERMTLESIIRTVKPTGLFKDEEILEFCTAITNAKYSQPYTILGKKYEKPRKPRNLRDKQLKNVTLGFVISKRDIEKKVFLPPFQLFGTEWFLRCCFWGKYLSIYLYNKIIFDGGVLDQPFETSVKFTLLNINPKKSKQAGFTKTWDKIKAWGYSNFIESEGLYDPINGWVDEVSDDLRIEIEIERTDNPVSSE